MPRYVVLLNWTEQGVRGFRDTVDRAEAARGAFAAVGARMTDIYWTVGPYDIVTVVEAPDDETLSATLLSLGGTGNLRSTTMRAFDADEMRGVIAKAA